MGMSYTFYAKNKIKLKYWSKNIGKYTTHINFNKKYNIAIQIGQGSFSIVYTAHKLPSFEKICVKIIDKELLRSSASFAVFLFSRSSVHFYRNLMC